MQLTFKKGMTCGEILKYTGFCIFYRSDCNANYVDAAIDLLILGDPATPLMTPHELFIPLDPRRPA